MTRHSSLSSGERAEGCCIARACTRIPSPHTIGAIRRAPIAPLTSFIASSSSSKVLGVRVDAQRREAYVTLASPEEASAVLRKARSEPFHGNAPLTVHFDDGRGARAPLAAQRPRLF